MFKSKKAIKLTTGEAVFTCLNYIILTIIMILCIYPFYYVFINSVVGAKEANAGVLLWPHHFVFSTYIQLIASNSIAHAFFISVARSVIATVLVCIFTSMLAYLVTQKEMFGRRFVYRFVIITMYVSAGLIPWYLTMKMYHLDNSFLLYVLPYCINAYFMILIKTFIESIPSSLEESASIDGAGFFTIFFKIIFPLITPIVATVAVYQFVSSWNTYMDNYLLVSNQNLQTLQLILYHYLNQAAAMVAQMSAGNLNNMDSAKLANQVSIVSIQNTITIITVLPIMLVYPFLQRFFTKGLMLGAVKG
jgi:putative aldouronate transport system permease protein